MGGKRGWVHVAASYYHDVVPCIKQRVPVIWVNRGKQKLEASQKKPTAEVTNLRGAAKMLGIS
jgi:2-haloacid dehalogenase/putative hydrolase of the HAD superfamily